jgi:tetratricopeptide (TPR) repeat protein
MSAHSIAIFRGTVILVAFAASVIFFLYRWYKGSRDRSDLIFRWVLTALALAAMWYGAISSRQAYERGDYSAIFAVFYAALGGIFLAALWVPVFVGAIGQKIGTVFDGGDVEIEPRPYYSVFLAKRAKGEYFEALAEVRRQLDKFPTDVEGQLLLADLQAENLNDLPGAEVTIQRLCSQPGHAPTNIADALHRLADLHLKLAKDHDAARHDLEQIIALLPESEMALVAAQRIARLAGTDALLAPVNRPAVVMPKGVGNLGLMENQELLKPVETGAAEVAAARVKHLEEHPFDTLAREELAVIYARHYHRLDLALDQLEQLVQQPNHPPKQVIHWLNLMADLQVQEGAEPDRVLENLQRIVDLFPNLAAAETARRRMITLKLEFRGQQQSHPVAIGNYEQNIGLKGTKLPPGEKPSFSPIR